MLVTRTASMSYATDCNLVLCSSLQHPPAHLFLSAVSFSRGRPFKPFEQLLAVLPAASCSLLPPAFQWLMTDPRSPVLDFYPEKFDIRHGGQACRVGGRGQGALHQ